MTENERLATAIKFLIESKKVRNQQEFVERIGSNKTDISLFKNGNKKITNGLFAKISNAFPCLSYEWLENGVGDMVNPIKEQMLYGGEDFETPTYIPLLPISAQGGSLNDFIVSVKDSDCERVISPIRGADFAMTVAGDSMAPEYPSGSQVLIKKVNEKAFIDWGRVYVLDTCNGSVIKRIFPAEDKDPGKVKCVSINPDYPSFEVSFEDIFGVYRVLLSMSIK